MRLLFPLFVVLGMAPVMAQNKVDLMARPGTSRAEFLGNEPLSANEITSLSERFARLWKPSGYPSIITVKMRLSPDGYLIAPPQVMTSSTDARFPAAAQSAVQAIQAAQPFRMLRKESYGHWKELEVDFDPQQTQQPQTNENSYKEVITPYSNGPDIRGLSVGMTAEQVIAALSKSPDCAYVAIPGCLVWTFGSCSHEAREVDALGEMKCAYLTEDRTNSEALELKLTSKLKPNIVKRIYFRFRSGSSLSQVSRIAAEKYGKPTSVLLNRNAGQMFDGAFKKVAIEAASTFGLSPIDTDSLPTIQVTWRIADKVILLLSPDDNSFYSMTMLLEGTESLEQRAADEERKQINPKPRF